jgi:hypothetical protein
MDETEAYYRMAQTDYPDLIASARGAFGRSRQARVWAAECAYIKMHQALPEWGVMVQEFHFINGSHIFVQRDPDALDD